MAVLEFLFRADRRADEDIGFHKHQCYELVYYAHGEGYSRIGGADWTYRQGEFALIRPLTLHNERHRQATEVICVGFSCAPSDEPLPEGVFRSASGDGIQPALQALLREMQEQQPHYSDMLNLLIGQLLILLSRAIQGGQAAPSADKIYFTRKYIDEHFTQKIDFPALSALAGYSYDHYRHLFKRETGLSPQQYVLHRRLAYARSLLRHSNQSISSIAMACGLSGDSQFCTLFRREVGMPPGEYRRSVR